VCAAVAGAIAAGVTAATAVGGAAMSATQGGGEGGGGEPTQRSLKGFPPATAIQSYTARLLAENMAAGTRPPTFSEWVGSGGKARYEMVRPAFTPKEAEQLGMVGPEGGPVPWFDPRAQTGLTKEQKGYLGRRRMKARRLEAGEAWPETPEEKIAARIARERRKRRRAGGLGPPPAPSERILEEEE
jgi:hypothetical protein